MIVRLTSLHHRCAGIIAHSSAFYELAAVVYPDQVQFYFYGIKKPRNKVPFARGCFKDVRYP